MKNVQIADELTKIYAKRGRLDPETTLEEATAPEHPLHDEFEWDNEAAGHAHRLRQAHDMIRFVTIQVPGPDPERRSSRVRSFFAIQEDANKYRYEPVDVVRRSPELTASVLDAVEKELRVLILRNSNLAGFFPMAERVFKELSD